MLNYILMILLPVPIAVILCWFMMKRSFKRSREVGVQTSQMEQKGLIRLLLCFAGILYVINLVELIVLLRRTGILGDGYIEENVTATVDMGVTLVCLTSFFIAMLMGFACVKQNRREVDLLTSRISQPDPEAIRAGRNPDANRKLLAKLVILCVLAFIIMLASIWLIDLDESFWQDVEEEAFLGIKTFYLL